MQMSTTCKTLHDQLQRYRDQKHLIAFIPTMGNLHDGHLSLVELAKKHADKIIVSIFVNPLQFGANEDYATYPRTLAEDREKLKKASVDILFVPGDKEIYPDGTKQQTRISVPELADKLCGISRPHFFEGVTAAVARLFNIIQPNIAIFGKKDYQQLLIIKKMVVDLALPIKIIGAPIIRDADGLALSSRNHYLTPTERRQAPQLYANLIALKNAILAGDNDYQKLSYACNQRLQHLGFNPDYVSICRMPDLQLATADDTHIVIFAAAWLGQTRLIDNVEMQ